MTSRALLGAVIGAAVGAAVWAVVVATTGYEVGWIAWGIGLAVGMGAKALGGHGQVTGVTCAVVALLSIFAGKALAVRYSAPKQLRKVVIEAVSTREQYDELKRDAGDFAKLDSEEKYAEFMVSHGFHDGDSANQVKPEDVEHFKKTNLPQLNRFNDNQPTYERWREERTRNVDPTVDSLMAEFSTVDAVVESLGAMDILFAALGVMTAFKVVASEDG